MQREACHRDCGCGEEGMEFSRGGHGDAMGGRKDFIEGVILELSV